MKQQQLDITTLLAEALKREPHERDAFLEQACAGDPIMRRDLEGLLAAHERAGGFLQRPAVAHEDLSAIFDQQPIATNQNPEEEAGAIIGRYRLLNLLGEGGFGAVFLAQQREPVVREVALKIIKLGMDTRQVIERFEAERQTLAMMDHPNIARVFDAGQTDAARGSRPYFVMERVSGSPITDWCNRHQFDCRARLELFMTVCHAVQHAHQKGIIHRDLKPSNILVSEVDGVATPKIIDFGIAKAIVGEGIKASRLQGIEQDTPLMPQCLDASMPSPSLTAACSLIGTPQYMSPEQADPQADGVDTRSDIYSLGVVLYELLTGTTPLDAQALRGASHDRLRHMIHEQTVERPSTRITRLGDAAQSIASRQQTDVPALRRRLRDDLDWIALRALNNQRERRYASASALADDIRRHLRHEPVMASPSAAGYRVRKFVRRHRVGVVAASLIALAVIGGAMGTTVGMLRARDSAEQASAAATQARQSAEQALAVNQFMRDVLTSVEPEHQGADVRLIDVLANASTTAPQRFADHPEMEAQVRDLLAQVYDRLSMWREAKAECARAAALWRQHAGPDDPRALLSERRYYGAALNIEDASQAERALPELVTRTKRVFGPDAIQTLDVLRALGIVHMIRGRYDEAEPIYLDIRARLQAGVDDDDMQIRVLLNLIQLHHRRTNMDDPVNWHATLTHIEPLARERLERSLRRFGPQSTVTMESQLLLAENLDYQGNSRAAADLCRAVLDVPVERLGECHHVRVRAMSVLGRATSRLGEARESAELNLREIACLRQRSPDGPALLSAISDALPCLDRAGFAEDGEALARELHTALATFGGHGSAEFNAELYTAKFISMQDRLDEAELMFQSLFTRASQMDSDGPRARLHLYYGSHLVRRGMFEDAERELQTAVDLRGGDPRHGTWLSHPDDIVVEFIALYEAWGRPDEVTEYQQVREEILARSQE